IDCHHYCHEAWLAPVPSNLRPAMPLLWLPQKDIRHLASIVFFVNLYPSWHIRLIISYSGQTGYSVFSRIISFFHKSLWTGRINRYKGTECARPHHPKPEFCPESPFSFSPL